LAVWKIEEDLGFYLKNVELSAIDENILLETTHPDKKLEKTKMQFDEDIKEDLEVDEFKSITSLEFNLYLKGLA
jgi:hypothetical protein